METVDRGTNNKHSFLFLTGFQTGNTHMFSFQFYKSNSEFEEAVSKVLPFSDAGLTTFVI
ncbi:hypothetical protein D1631_13340 [Chryseobacterium nematophagum]|uniref:Uncharacterized protein n=1 Tax=Chryseobacterium nematophagum TaxID=2305228 RepID=A0A3M7TIK8_9FLAO|nr:hypothetical protein D1631_13340 [Chryseobacterium nematophagum]